MILKAVKEGNLALVKELLEQGEDVNKKTYEEELTPLHIAILNKDIPMIYYLLEQGADIEAEDIGGNRPLHLAVALNLPEIVELLLKQGADVNAKARYGRTPIMFSVVDPSLKLYDMLIKYGASPLDKDIEESTLLHYAATNSNIPMINLLTSQINVNSTNIKGETPLHFAAWKGDLETINALLEQGANLNIPNKEGLYPVDYAALSNHLDVVKVLLDKGAEFSKKDYNLLHHASALGDLELVKKLVPLVDINSKDKDLLTPLHYAIWNKHINVAKYLLEKGADPEAKDLWGQTPKDYAKQKNLTLF